MSATSNIVGSSLFPAPIEEIIGTLASYEKLADYYKRENVVPIYIEADDFTRLERAIRREHKQASPKYDEVCRRFLADTEDFAPEKLAAAGVGNVFVNQGDLMDTVEEIAVFIKKEA